MSIITTALAKCSLLLLMIVALFNGSFGSTTPGSLMDKIVSILTGEGLQRFNIVPGNLLNAVICPAIGIYILRAVRRWLGSELLPKTISDVGIRASLVTLFSNIGYVLVILITRRRWASSGATRRGSSAPCRSVSVSVCRRS